MDLKQIRYFIVVCELRSVSRAAEILDVSQPSISRQIQLLEAELRQHLLRRTGRGMEPTEAGLRFLSHARALDKLANHARQDLQSFQSPTQGKVRLGLPPRIARRLTPLIVQEFRAQMPNSSIRIVEGLSADMRGWLIKSKIDLALLYDPTPAAMLSYETIYREDMVLAYAKTCRPRPPKNIKAGQLERYPLVLPSRPNSIRTLVDRICHDAEISLNIVAEVDVVQTAVETISYDQVYTIIPRSAIHDTPHRKELTFSCIKEPVIKNSLVLAMLVHGANPELTQTTAHIVRHIDMAKYMA
ncbi:LysR family transcriptional regulator [Paralcaligenes ureilyticus]|uniref:LysR family transcriptional regulator n=1 Tax=Paralcaligenes ureilyticus TaxID=627131 RepID=A0A4R3M3Z1_9BURK|nr:LysR family transcriptional regulator [Paralcaligenes ureilyticus]TCT06969.1 LysR family transcriptional regulator [Paralcaligenes ureilyticus]